MDAKVRDFRELDQSWKGRTFVFRYTTAFHYRVEINRQAEGIKIELRREALPEPIQKSFESSLFSDWLENPWVLAVFEGEKMIAFVETADETWNNRLRVANIWVDEAYRYQGIGKILIAKTIEKATKAGQRALVLETQSCNDPALRFYRSCGFELVGLDTTHYQNDDIQRGEVSLELGMRLEPAGLS